MGIAARPHRRTGAKRHLHASPDCSRGPGAELGVARGLRVGIIGCGLIGQKRARTLAGRASLSVCCDVQAGRAEALAKSYPSAAISTDWKSVLRHEDVDAVLVCATHDQLAPIAEAAALAGKHVLIEKPGARRAAELIAV